MLIRISSTDFMSVGLNREQSSLDSFSQEATGDDDGDEEKMNVNSFLPLHSLFYSRVAAMSVFMLVFCGFLTGKLSGDAADGAAVLPPSSSSSRSSSSHSSSFSPAADGGETGRPERAHLQTLPGGGQERQRGSVVRGFPVPHAQGDPPASQLGLHISPLPPSPLPPWFNTPCKGKRFIFFLFFLNKESKALLAACQRAAGGSGIGARVWGLNFTLPQIWAPPEAAN